MDYLGHQILGVGLGAHPKDLVCLVDLPFPRSLRAMQSFLGSLNYYGCFTEDLAVYTSVLYELRELDFAEIRTRNRIQSTAIKTDEGPAESEPYQKWAHAEAVFTALNPRSRRPRSTSTLVLRSNQW